MSNNVKYEQIVSKELLNINEENIADLIRDANTAANAMTFVLGAGVSMSLGYPNWGALLAKAIGNIMYIFDGEQYHDGRKDAIKALKHTAENYDANHPLTAKFDKGRRGEYGYVLQNTNLLETADYIYNFLYSILEDVQDRKQRADITDKQLVSLMRRCMMTTESELEYQLDNGVQGSGRFGYDGSTIQAVVDVICNRSKNGKIHHDVITYNYDNLLEYCLKNRGGVPEDKILSISHTDKKNTLDTCGINISHVHGKFNITDRKDASNNIILSERSYYAFENVNYQWSHIIQAEAMLNKTCVFVGFSADDHNFRRIIKNIEHIKHSYILFAVDDIVNAVFGRLIEQKQHSQSEEKYREKVKAIIDNRLSNEKKKQEVEALQISSNDAQSYNDILEELLSSDEYAYERLLLTYIITSQTQYWGQNGIKVIWTTISELPDLIRKLK